MTGQAMDELTHRLFEAYHGTDLAFAKIVADQNMFIPSVGDSEWLGDGIYFFENDRDEAKDWAILNRHHPNPIVIYCTVRSQRLFDLTLKANQHKLGSLIKTLTARFRTQKHKPKIMDGKAINMICGELNYDVVRGIFKLESRLMDSISGYTRIQRTQIQLCVRENDCIDWTTFKGWDTNGTKIF